MYAPYDVYNFCELCQSACLGNEVEIVRQRTADLRKKVKLLEEDIINDTDDCGPFFTIGTGESSYNLKSPPKAIPPCNYQVYPVTLPGYHFSQCIRPGAPSASTPSKISDPDNKDAISKSGSTASSKGRSRESLKSQTKEKDVQVKSVPSGTLVDDNLSNDNPTKLSSECKEMLQLCTTLINELREARTDFKTIVNKCLEDRANIDNVGPSSSKEDEKMLLGKTEQKMSECREKKKWGRINKDEKSTKDERIDPNAMEDKKLARPEVLTTLVDCLETMKTRPECASMIEELIDRLENKIIIKRSCDCPRDMRYSDVKLFNRNVEDSVYSSYQRTANCSCLKQEAYVNLRTVPVPPSAVPSIEFREDKSTKENRVQEVEDYHKKKIIEEKPQVQKDLVKRFEDNSEEPKNIVERANMSPIINNSFLNESVEKSDENKKLLNHQESYGGCCCHGNRQPYCTCGPHPEPPCGSEAFTVTKKCTQKADKKGKQPKESKTTTRKRPCFHIWPESTRCLKRCPNRI